MATRSKSNSSADPSEQITNLINNSEFKNIISSIIKSEVQVLYETISDLKSEVEVLRESNIQLIHMLAPNNPNPNETNLKPTNSNKSNTKNDNSTKSKNNTSMKNKTKPEEKTQPDKKEATINY